MAFFKATFGCWINDDEPVIEASGTAAELAEYKNRKLEFIIEARDIGEALVYARTFEGIETHSFEGLASLEVLIEIQLDEVHNLGRLAIYESYRHS